jgi:hypothetical protein
MKENARTYGLVNMVAPVRPMLKAIYPLAPIDAYVAWKTADGRMFDPWLRTHLALGARVLRMAPRSLEITGSVADWESWTGMKFPATGNYVVTGALAPVAIDHEFNRGIYLQPNVWMHHPL